MAKSNLGYWILGIVAVAIAATLVPFLTHANPLEFLVENQGNYTVTATTSVTYLTAGVSTSTSYVFDTYANGNANTYATNNLALAIQFTASSTASSLGWYLEYAQGTNCVNVPNSCDWYQDNTFVNATSSPISTISTDKYQWAFASSTQGGAAGAGNRANKIVLINPIARYVRAVFYLNAGSAPGAVWSEFIGQKQSAN